MEPTGRMESWRCSLAKMILRSWVRLSPGTTRTRLMPSQESVARCEVLLMVCFLLVSPPSPTLSVSTPPTSADPFTSARRGNTPCTGSQSQHLSWTRPTSPTLLCVQTTNAIKTTFQMVFRYVEHVALPLLTYSNLSVHLHAPDIWWYKSAKSFHYLSSFIILCKLFALFLAWTFVVQVWDG